MKEVLEIKIMEFNKLIELSSIQLIFLKF